MKGTFDMIWRIGFSICLLVLAVSCSNQLPATPAELPTPFAFTSTAAAAPTQLSASATTVPARTPIPSNTSVPSTTIPIATAASKAPTRDTTAIPTAAQRRSQLTITLADNGKTITLQIGERFLLDLGAEYDWQVTVDTPSIVSAVPNTARNGNQGLYEAHQKGTAELAAVGNPKCYNAVPRCLVPSRLFQLKVVVASGTPAAELSVTPADDGKTITLQTGQTFLLNLGDQYKWTVDVTDPSVLSRVANASMPEGAQGIYKANRPGTTTLTATGPMNCPPDRVCIMIIREFRIQVVVR